MKQFNAKRKQAGLAKFAVTFESSRSLSIENYPWTDVCEDIVNVSYIFLAFDFCKALRHRLVACHLFPPCVPLCVLLCAERNCRSAALSGPERDICVYGHEQH